MTDGLGRTVGRPACLRDTDCREGEHDHRAHDAMQLNPPQFHTSGGGYALPFQQAARGVLERGAVVDR